MAGIDRIMLAGWSGRSLRLLWARGPAAGLFCRCIYCTVHTQKTYCQHSSRHFWDGGSQWVLRIFVAIMPAIACRWVPIVHAWPGNLIEPHHLWSAAYMPCRVQLAPTSFLFSRHMHVHGKFLRKLRGHLDMDINEKIQKKKKQFLLCESTCSPTVFSCLTAWSTHSATATGDDLSGPCMLIQCGAWQYMQRTDLKQVIANHKAWESLSRCQCHCVVACDGCQRGGETSPPSSPFPIFNY